MRKAGNPTQLATRRRHAFGAGRQPGAGL